MRAVGLRLSRFLRSTAAAAVVFSGCRSGQPKISYLGDAEFSYYRANATEIDYPALEFATDDQVATTAAPHTLLDVDEMPIRDITLAEAIRIGLTNAEIIRNNGQFLSPNNNLYTAGERAPSNLDPAIQESGVLFGGRGIEAALSDFDAQLNSSLFWRRNRQYQNQAIAAPGTPASIAEVDQGLFNIGLQKQFAQGGTVTLDHDVNYNFSNTGTPLFPSAFTGDVIAAYRQPLLAGAGSEFTRIAGPIQPNFGGITGVSQGVVIARINNDISIADFEAALRNLVKDIEDNYWDLYLAYRQYDVAVTAYNAAAATWRQADIEFETGTTTRAAAAQAKDQLFATRAQADNARSGIYAQETRFRRLIGLAVNDGAVLRPADEPITAQFIPDWKTSLTESLTRRLELRRQKWLIKSLDLQLRAAKNLTRPQLDILAEYRLNGFGDHLIGVGEGDDAGTTQGLNNFYSTLTRADTTGYGIGVELNIPIGFRSALAQVRNYELRLAKAQKVLAVQEQEIAQELAAAFQEVARSYAAAKSNMNRYLAAEENVRFLEPRRRERDLLIDEFLRAQTRRAEAESAYFTSLIEYNKSLTNLFFREERLLAHDNISLSEGPWVSEAYADAERRAWARSYAIDNDHLHTVPEVFASPAPVDGPEFAAPREPDVGPVENPAANESAPAPDAPDDSMPEESEITE